MNIFYKGILFLIKPLELLSIAANVGRADFVFFAISFNNSLPRLLLNKSIASFRWAVFILRKSKRRKFGNLNKVLFKMKLNAIYTQLT